LSHFATHGYTAAIRLGTDLFRRGSLIVYFYRASLAVLVSTALLSPWAMASRVHRAPTSGQTPVHKSTAKSAGKTSATTATNHKTSVKKGHRAPKKRGQQAIDSERVMQIQQALIREHYMNGEASGNWDSTTQAAMQKYQSDQGWQTKLMPDSRALKKLGLGPDYSNAINAQNSSFAAPAPVSTIPTEQAAGFAAAAGVSQR
jgi:peptidoglycan hydrolase-like protein with peptidoglycan-binding domain